MMQYYQIFKAQSFSGSAVKFLKKEIKDYILSKSGIIEADSKVFDVGGDTGVWALQIYEKYKPDLYIFEPHPESVKVLAVS